MVNVPPIPPLLCSTPPPIDFGEDDEDIENMPPTLDDGEFGDFLAIDSKNNDPLPSPPPSVCDLPSVSIYDGLILPNEDYKTNKNGDCDKTTKSVDITETLNLNVKIVNKEPQKKLQDIISPSVEANLVEEINTLTEENNNSKNEKEIESLKLKVNIPQENQEYLHLIETSNKNCKHLSIETSRVESKCIQNIVSIEDIEDDLSDDELYSPKTPKNFTDTNSVHDYFVIEEIKGECKRENDTNPDRQLYNKDINSKSINFLDNNESSSSKSYPLQTPDISPPLEDDAKRTDDDEFGDFADFQDFDSGMIPPESQFNPNNAIPVDEINNRQRLNNNDLELNGFKKFESYNIKNDCENKNEPDLNDEFKDVVQTNNFDNFTSHTAAADEFKIEINNSQQYKNNFLELETNPQEISNANFEELNKSTLGINTSDKLNRLRNESFNIDNRLEDHNTVLENNDDYSKNFATFSKKPDNKSAITTDKCEYPVKIHQDDTNDDNDKFDDFANFEQHQEEVLNEFNKNVKTEFTNNDGNQFSDEDDDEFGDFNTAQPVLPTSSSITQPTTSQNILATAFPTLPSNNLNERISKILQLMFFTPPMTNACKTIIEPKPSKIQGIPFTPIDAAKALNYQWLDSNSRHSFIKSLGIDSRNILFGENWNPLLPRFAANLSFNPLKPMKPIQAYNSEANSSPTSESVSESIVESNKTVVLSDSNKKEHLELDWKSNTTRQIDEACNNNKLTSETTKNAAACMPFISNEPPQETAMVKKIENHPDNKDAFSKTPPISEMESVATFSLPLAVPTLKMELPLTQNTSNPEDFALRGVEENLENNLNINEVVVSSTFAGSFKETHIYTPLKTNNFETQQSSVSPSPYKAPPIDFDYEKAAMGVVIDETVVKKEYRDVEYIPPFSLESLNRLSITKTEMSETNIQVANTKNVNTNNIKMPVNTSVEEEEFNDEFTEFQSVQSEASVPTSVIPKTTATNSKSLDVYKMTTVSHGGMILSPAILIPQAISMENQKPKIEWGDSTATINPEELARIEELFPEPKSLKSSNASNSSQKSTPTHQVISTPSISAAVASKELEGNINNDDDDWSDFVSVTVTNNISTNKSGSNNNVSTKSPTGSPLKQKSPNTTYRTPSSTYSNSNNDDEWSDFVSSTPQSAQPPSTYRVPQFNSGAWQNANFYNNPLSMYHKSPINVPTTTSQPTSKSLYNNNNNYNSSTQSYQIANNISPVVANQPLPNSTYQQQIHVMQNFSTASISTSERPSAVGKNNQFQVGSAKIAPSAALVPDLGFVAPAIPTHTSFINSLPKPSINMKK